MAHVMKNTKVTLVFWEMTADTTLYKSWNCMAFLHKKHWPVGKVCKRNDTFYKISQTNQNFMFVHGLFFLNIKEVSFQKLNSILGQDPILSKFQLPSSERMIRGRRRKEQQPIMAFFVLLSEEGGGGSAKNTVKAWHKAQPGRCHWSCHTIFQETVIAARRVEAFRLRSQKGGAGELSLWGCMGLLIWRGARKSILLSCWQTGPMG